jgi:hypothetical protein
MPWVEIALPGTILGVKFLLKLFVDRTATAADLGSSITALPVDVIFLAISLSAGLAIARPEEVRTGLVLFSFFLAAAVLNIAMSRRSESFLIGERYALTAIVTVLNFTISLAALLLVLRTMSAGTRP